MAEPPGQCPAAASVRGGGERHCGRTWQTRRNPATQSYGTKAGPANGRGRLSSPDCEANPGKPGDAKLWGLKQRAEGAALRLPKAMSAQPPDLFASETWGVFERALFGWQNPDGDDPQKQHPVQRKGDTYEKA